MNDKKGVIVECRHEKGKEQVFKTGAKSFDEIHFDFSNLTREEISSEHLGARLLLCAALSCYTNTFTNNLHAKGVDVHSMKARATVSKEKDDTRRTRYTIIYLELKVGVEKEDEAVFKMVREDMTRGSLLTYSLDEGIEVEYDVTRV
ncbi:MAG: OsmC family protein [Deltaproteobacteria bacterium]|nr:OsmC family protein [Deltaproteobacteria bacterium]